MSGCEESPGNAGVSPAQPSSTGVSPCHPAVSSQPRCQRGAFTLIEALVAIALAAVVLPVALAAISDGARTVERARRLDLARRVAETRLARMLSDGSWLTAATSGDCDPAADGEDAAGLRWQLAVSTWRDPAVRRIHLVVGRDPAAGIETVAVETLAEPTSEAAP